jgi:hypothetical protein
MPIFRRKPKPPPMISIDLPSGEEVERAVAAELLRGKAVLRGALFMTNRRLMFEARRGDARWMIVPYDEVASAGLYPAPSPHLGGPPSRRQCLCVETTKGEQVWWDFTEKDEREWLPLMLAKVDAARATTSDDP